MINTIFYTNPDIEVRGNSPEGNSGNGSSNGACPIAATNLAAYNNVKALYDNLQDGGNTQILNSEIETAFPSDMWQLRSELLGVSPHVSKEVLMTTAEKTDVFPESVLFDILSANPDELRKEELISYLENKGQPLPEYMIDILKQLANGITYKTILLNQMSEYHHKKVSAAQDIIRSILNDSITDMVELRSWLDNIGGMVADKQIISTYMQERDHNPAQDLLDMLPTLYELTGDDLLAFNDYKTMVEFQINLVQQGRNMFELDSTELSVLVNLAENGKGSAKANARGILEYAYGYHYCDCPSLPETIGLKNSNVAYEKLIRATGLEINAEPNPASTWVTFNYYLPENNPSATIIISDANGITVDRINISGEQGQHVWDCRKTKPGVYIYKAESANYSVTGKLIIK